MDEPKRYDSAKHLVSLVALALNVLILVYLLTSGSSIRIREFAQSFSDSQWIQIAIYTLVIGAVFELFNLPLSFFSDYWLEHRFGLSRQSPGGWIGDELKSLAISANT